MVKQDEKPQDELLTVHEAMKWLRVGRYKLDELVKSGELEIIDIGPRSGRITRASVEALLRRRKRKIR